MFLMNILPHEKNIFQDLQTKPLGVRRGIYSTYSKNNYRWILYRI